MPTLDEIHILIIRVEGKIDHMTAVQTEFMKWREKHEFEANKKFDKIQTQVGNMRTYGNSIAIVAGFFGVGLTWMWGKLTGKY